MHDFKLGESKVKKDEQLNRFSDHNYKRMQKNRALTVKHNHKKDEKIKEMRQAEVEAMEECRQDHHIVQAMNMSRRKRMQSEYRQGLVEAMLDKKYRAQTLEKIRGDIVTTGSAKQKNVAGNMYSVFTAGAHTMQPQTIETYKKDYDVERKRKAKAKLEGAAN